MALTTYTGFAITLFNGVAVAGAVRPAPAGARCARPFRTFGYPFAPGLFAVVSLLIVANALWTDLVGPLLRRRAARPVGGGPARDRSGAAALCLVHALRGARQGSGLTSWSAGAEDLPAFP